MILSFYTPTIPLMGLLKQKNIRILSRNTKIPQDAWEQFQNSIDFESQIFMYSNDREKIDIDIIKNIKYFPKDLYVSIYPFPDECCKCHDFLTSLSIRQLELLLENNLLSRNSFNIVSGYLKMSKIKSHQYQNDHLCKYVQKNMDYITFATSNTSTAASQPVYSTTSATSATLNYAIAPYKYDLSNNISISPYCLYIEEENQ